MSRGKCAADPSEELLIRPNIMKCLCTAKIRALLVHVLRDAEETMVVSKLAFLRNICICRQKCQSGSVWTERHVEFARRGGTGQARRSWRLGGLWRLVGRPVGDRLKLLGNMQRCHDVFQPCIFTQSVKGDEFNHQQLFKFHKMIIELWSGAFEPFTSYAGTLFHPSRIPRNFLKSEALHS